MSLAIVHSRANVGITAIAVTVETHISNGLPQLSIVGLPEAAVKESKDRVRSALLNTHFEFPTRRITVNLAPADLPKEGGRFDLPIALGILAASGQIPLAKLAEYEFVGELALSGELRPIQGALPFALAAKANQRQIILPMANADEASLVHEIKVYGAHHLLEVCAHLQQKTSIPLHHFHQEQQLQDPTMDIAEVQGQQHAKRALEIVAAGGHSLLMVGPPGSGKTMLASRLPSIMPALSQDQALELAAILSISGKPLNPQFWHQPPFRSPHHASSSAALVGGGNPPRPGEISLAHHGILFLDELPEFKRHVLEALREPLESGCIHISRAGRQAQFPAHFQLIAAMNPCPCGYQGSLVKECTCTQEQIRKYTHKISGPLLDRIDLHIQVPAIPQSMLTSTTVQGEGSAQLRQKVLLARKIQFERSHKMNAQLTSKEIAQYAALDTGEQQLLTLAAEKLGLSARAYFRTLRIARTIADLSHSEAVKKNHLTEALSFRPLINS